MRAFLLLAAVLAPLTTLAQAATQVAAAPAVAAPPVAQVAAAPAVAAPSLPPSAGPAAIPPLASPAPKAGREGPYVGFSFGTGRGDVYAGNTTTAVGDLVPGVTPTTYALMLRAGWASGDLLWGMQLNLIRSEWRAGGSTSAMQLTGVDLTATWMPQDLGMFVRAGIGPANLAFEGNGFVSDSYGGAEVMLGIGIASGGFGVAIDYVRQTYDDGAPIDGASYLLATLSLDLG